MDLIQFTTRQLELLALERDAEVEENRILQECESPKELARRGVCVMRLRVGSLCTELYGRAVITYESTQAMQNLPAHKLSSGDIVGVCRTNAGNKVLKSGVVTKTTASSITVAFEYEDISDLNDSDQYHLLKLANDVTYRRIRRNIEDLHKNSNPLCDVLFGSRGVSDPLPSFKGSSKLAFYNTNLNDSQKEAVIFALCQKEVAVVHGPPGTGKTTTVVEIILQAVNLGQKVLVCAPSNIAVDNVVEKLADCKVPIVRLGHPARLQESIQQYSLDAILTSSDNGKLLDDIRRDIDKTQAEIKVKEGFGSYKLYSELRNFRQELRSRTKKATKELLQRASVVLSTLTGSFREGPLKYLTHNHFDFVVIDECSQATEAACWISLLYAPKCILAGDHKQLPPTIVSEDALKKGLGITLMERALEMYGDEIVRMLTVQYRMHEDIMKWSSDHMYNGKLKAHSCVCQHLLRDLPGVEDDENTATPLVFIDTAGCDLHEIDLEDESSKGNEGEAEVVALYVETLITAGVKPADIAIITPYNLQVELLKLRLPSYNGLEISSVDGFQGREKEVVIITLVRSNLIGEVGFLSDIRRMNVAITRARRHLVLIGDSETVSHDPELKTLIDYVINKGDVRTAYQYPQGEGACASERILLLKTKKVSRHSVSAPGMKRILEKVGKNGASEKTSKKSTSEKTAKKSTSEKTETKTENPATDTPDPRKAYEEKYTAVIARFMEDDDAKEYRFSNTLSPYERMIVHEVAESKRLVHVSEGEGNRRHIIIKKLRPTIVKSTPRFCDYPFEKVIEDELKVIEKTKEQTEIEKKKEETASGSSFDKGILNPEDVNVEALLVEVCCSVCGKLIPKYNFQLHSLRCKKNPGASSKNNGQAREKQKMKQPKPGTSKQSEIDGVDKNDFEGLIAAAAKANGTCHFSKCKTLTSVIGQDCEFCAQRYCLSHFIPEVHGCGEEARVNARRTVVREGKIYSGSGVPNKKPNATKRAHLERRLDKKLSEMANQRKPKKK